MKCGLFQIDIETIANRDINLKKELLLFDEVIICNEEALYTETFGHKYVDEILNYYKGLIGNEIIKTLDSKEIENLTDNDSEETALLLKEKRSLDKERNQFWEKMKNRDKYKDFEPNKEFDLYHWGVYSSDIVNRLISIHMNSVNPSNEYIPIQKKHFPSFNNEKNQKDMVINLALKEFPIIDDKTPIEQVIEFRNEDDLRLRYFELRDFITNLSKQNLSEIEIKDKFEYLLNEYKNGLKLAELKYTNSTLETICIAGAEFVENLAKLKFSSAVKKLFELSKQDFELLEAEKGLKGRELSFIYYANQRFQG